MRLRALAAAVLAAVLMVAGPAPARAADVHVLPFDPVAVDDPEALLELYREPTGAERALPVPARCGAGAADPVPDGQPIRVSMPPGPTFTVGSIPASWWRNPPSADPLWRLQFLGMMWVRPLAVRAAQDDQLTSLAVLAEQIAAFHRQNPDPKTSTYGWDEGTALRRLESENCLYAMTRSASLKQGMNADVAVLLSSRYYGPPYRPVHNHGLMANLQLFRAGVLLNKTTWQSIAVQRLTSEAPQAFSRLGTTWEQASAYQGTIAGLWGQAAAVLEERPGSEAAAESIRRTVAAARIVAQWMTDPDGKVVQVGDSDLIAGTPGTLTEPGVFRDDQAGWVIGRWSWSDRATSHYTVRYGPPRRAHGHHDRAGGVTWSTRGVRVLVGPGRYTSDLTSAFYAYQVGPSGQNTAIPSGRAAGDGAAAVTASRLRSAAHNWTINDKVYGIAHTRGVYATRDVPSLTVSDVFAGNPRWRQYWHLDQAWTHVSGGADGNRLVFAHPTGRRLTITTTGLVSGVVRGVKQPVQGYNFPAYGIRYPAYEISIRSYGRASTTFVVS
jgi:hypothetical protein